MSAEEKVIPIETRESIPDTCVYAEFDVFYDEARRQGSTIAEAGQIAGFLIMKHEAPSTVE